MLGRTVRILICLTLGVVTTLGVALASSYYNFTKNKESRTVTPELQYVVLDDESSPVVYMIQNRIGAVSVSAFQWPEHTAEFIKKLDTMVDPPPISYGRGALPWWSIARRSELDSVDVPDGERAYGFPFVCLAWEMNRINSQERREMERVIRKRYHELRRHAEPEDWPNLSAQQRDEIDAIVYLHAEYTHGIEYSNALTIDWKIKTDTRRKFSASYTPGAWPLNPIWPHIVANITIYTLLFWITLFGPGVLRRTLRVRRGACVKCGYDLRGGPDCGCPECGWNRKTDQPHSRAVG